jgi:hypothetical protein
LSARELETESRLRAAFLFMGGFLVFGARE